MIMTINKLDLIMYMMRIYLSIFNGYLIKRIMHVYVYTYMHTDMHTYIFVDVDS